jgi:molybdopterin-containing oxidoreductase family molybdopterin binding subunit
LGGWQLPKTYPGTKTGPNCLDLPEQATKTKGIFAAGNPFQQLLTNANATTAWLDNIDFIALAEVYNSASVQYADIVLPVCSYFECEGDIGAVSITKDRLMVRQKVIEPLFESKTDFEIQKELCARFGNVDDLPGSLEEMVRHQLANSANPVVKGITLEDLIDKQCAMTLVGAMERPNRILEDQVYMTPSGRLELYYEHYLEDNQAFATYETPTEAYEENPLHEKYPFVYTNIKSKYRGQSRFYYAKWINQYVVPELEINPADAAARGLETGDNVEIFNDRGSFGCKCRLNPSIRPGTIKSDQGIPPSLLSKGLIGNVINNHKVARSDKFRFGPPSCYSDNLVEVRKAGGEA